MTYRIAIDVGGTFTDLVLIDWPEGGVPSIIMTMSNGKIAYLADRR